MLFLTSAPQHSLWYLGLAAGPCRDDRCALVQTHWREDRVDFLLETLKAGPQDLFTELRTFPKLVSRPRDRLLHGRRVLAALTRYAREFRPDCIMVGNDSHPEFYAALRGAPDAIGVYVDDGWGTYRSRSECGGLAAAWQRLKTGASVRARRLTFGVDNERPALVGGSRAVHQAWIMAPDYANAALSGKLLQSIESEWFHDPRVVGHCAAAIRRAGLDPDCLQELDLLLVLPHEAFLRRHPELRGELQKLIDNCAARGGRVAFKHHPRMRAGGLHFPERQSVEIPQRLPAEILAPLLSQTLVVGIMTSALIFLPRLRPGIRVQALVPHAAMNDPVTRIYRNMGVELLEQAMPE